MTHEPELTVPVDLCAPDGGLLNPAARGWSRRPLHRANLDGGDLGRNKRWDYWAILAGDLIVSCVYSDIDVIGLADTSWAELSTGRTGGQGIITEPGPIRLPQVCETAELSVERDGLVLTMGAEDADGTHLVASWTEADGRPASFDKQVARPATGTLRVGDEEWAIGADGDAWGVLDVGRGRWPSKLAWNWGAASGRSGDTVVGLQFGAKWTEGTGFTENGFVIDGRVTKLGRELEWTYDWDDPMAPWTIVDPGGQLSVVLTPVFDKYTKAGDEHLGSEVHQVFGTYSGTITDDDGRPVEFTDLQGFAEEARQVW